MAPPQEKKRKMTRWMEKRVIRAAELRARAAAWTAVAAEVNSRPEICRRWPERYPEVWRAAYIAERQRAFQETNIVVLRSLKELLVNKDERIRLRAARLLKIYEREILRAESGSS